MLNPEQDNPSMIDVNGLFKSDHFVARLKSDLVLEISYAPPPPACYIFRKRGFTLHYITLQDLMISMDF